MTPVRCPICGKWFEPDEGSAMPFCSPRCKRIDLQRWLDERYGFPDESEEEPEDPGASDGGPAANS